MLHGGESNNPENDNLAAVLALDSKRIGHGFNLRQHGYLMETIKKRRICLEVNPVSNQVLRYIPDLQVHPAITFHQYGIPISISPDDPARFWVHGATFDWQVVALCFPFTLKDLKLLALNSIWHALASPEQVAAMEATFAGQWESFLDLLLAS